MKNELTDSFHKEIEREHKYIVRHDFNWHLGTAQFLSCPKIKEIIIIIFRNWKWEYFGETEQGYSYTFKFFNPLPPGVRFS